MSDDGPFTDGTAEDWFAAAEALAARAEADQLMTEAGMDAHAREVWWSTPSSWLDGAVPAELAKVSNAAHLSEGSLSFDSPLVAAHAHPERGPSVGARRDRLPRRAVSLRPAGGRASAVHHCGAQKVQRFCTSRCRVSCRSRVAPLRTQPPWEGADVRPGRAR